MPQDKDSRDKERSERRAAALRANLARRKDQARARRAPPSGPGPGAGGASEGSGPAAADTPEIVPDGEPG